MPDPCPDVPYHECGEPDCPDHTRSANEVFTRDAGRCRYCDDPVTLDGGPDGIVYDVVDPDAEPATAAGYSVDQVVLACRSCNAAKGTRSAKRWEAEGGPRLLPVPMPWPPAGMTAPDPITAVDADTLIDIDRDTLEAAAYGVAWALDQQGMLDTAEAIGFGMTEQVITTRLRTIARRVVGYVALKRNQAIDRGAVVIPTAYEDDGGDRWYIEGHVSPEAAVLAVVLEQATNVGPTEAIDFLTGGHAADPLFGAAEAGANELLTRVIHLWMVPDAGEETFTRCTPAAEGAKPYTVVSL